MNGYIYTKTEVSPNGGIYILTSPSGMQYVGKSNDLKRRIRQHRSGDPSCVAIYNAICHYGGIDNFDVRLIRYPGATHKALYAIEKWFISRLDTFNNGYNCTIGGDGVEHSDEVRQKISGRQKGSGNSMYGKTHTPESIEKMRQASLGKKHTHQTRSKMSNAQAGDKNHRFGQGIVGENEDLIWELVALGWSHQRIGDRLGVSKQAVTKFLQRRKRFYQSQQNLLEL